MALPSTPLKATERRADRWQQAMGVMQTEIDALAALQPALLRRMARHAVRPFFDPTLTSRCNAAQSEWRQACQEAIDEQTDQEHLDRIAEQANEMLETVREQIKALEEQIRIDPSDYELPARPDLPEPEIAAEPDGSPLIDSAWPWAEQSKRLIASKAYDGAEP
jgi:DNA repair exonuclease SbcCD ATPase subunit